MKPSPKDEKTLVMKKLDQLGIPYRAHCYVGSGAISGTEVAAVLGQNPDQVFKTLVTEAPGGGHYVFVIPVREELDLKKAALAAGVKSVTMLHQKELEPLTGYVHGGCSPIGMKKFFPTYIDETVVLFDTFLFSAGRIGYQVECSPEDLARVIPYETAPLTRE